MMVNPGKYRNIAILQRKDPNAVTPNGFIDENAWKDVKTIRCSILTEESKAVRTVYREDSVNNLEFKIIECRFFEDIQSNDRILIKGKPYDIEFINNMEEENLYYRIWIRRTN